MLRTLFHKLNPSCKHNLIVLRDKTKRRLTRLFFSCGLSRLLKFYDYGYDELLQSLRGLGIVPGDLLMVHSSFSPFSGFSGAPHDVTRALRECIGSEGTLLMMSMPYSTSARTYLEKREIFDVSRTVSRMGLVSEVFRRQKDVFRSVHPTHPVLAVGPLAEWLVTGHECCLYGCGPGSPFEKFYQKNGKILFLGVSFATFTFIHYVEHLLQHQLSFQLYGDEIYRVKVVDSAKRESEIEVKVSSPDALLRRRPLKLKRWLASKGRIRRCRVGLTEVMIVRAEDALFTAMEMTERGCVLY